MLTIGGNFSVQFRKHCKCENSLSVSVLVMGLHFLILLGQCMLKTNRYYLLLLSRFIGVTVKTTIMTTKYPNES